MGVVLTFNRQQQEPLIPGGEIRQQKPKGLAESIKDIYRQWRESYDNWLKGAGKSIEEGQKLAKSKTGIEQFLRSWGSEKSADKVKDVTEKTEEAVQALTNPENILKQITRIAVILVVMMIGIMALLKILPAGKILK